MRTRRVGSETSKTRSRLLDGTEQVMLEDGYAAVTYRSVADTAEVTPALVQYYFPTLDHLFLAVLGRRSDQNHQRLLSALESRPEEPLRVAWEFTTDETAASLLLEFMALANHRKAIRAAILDVISQTRKAQLEVIRARWDSYREASDGLSPEALLFLLHGIPKLVQLEETIGLTTAHYEILQYVQRRLSAVEPAPARIARGKLSRAGH
jgi:TetR/AcrR family transcriptional regulator, transcriptional repressor for nem operon